LAMMIDAPEADRVDVAVVAENVAREADAFAFATKLRGAHIAAEVFVTGSPRKRYDRAMKTRPGAIVSLDVRDGVPTRGFKLLDPSNAQAQRAHGIFDAP
jgi:histidyl-tRNA synthetase